MQKMETEFKWDANTPRAFARMKRAVYQIIGKENLSDWKKLRLTDVYLDHADRSFEKQKIAFRVRHWDSNWEATFKTRTEIVDGKAVRREETLPLTDVKNFPEAVHLLNKKSEWKGLCIRQLQPLFSIANCREVVQLRRGVLQAEMAFDSFQIKVAGRRVWMKEIELELKKGNSEDLENLARELTQASGLAYANISKVKTAVSLAQLWGEK